MKRIVINTLVACSILTTATYAEDNKKDKDALTILNDRLQELYKAKTKCHNKLSDCEMKHKDRKQCHDIEGQCYDIEDEIKRLLPIIREKELLQIIRKQ